VSAGAVTAGRGTGVVAAGAPLLEVLVAGNPNSGKSTLFNALTGASAKVSNYPGVTVSRTSAVLSLGDGRTVDLVDLPGTYSLSARSRDEQVAVDALIGRTGPPPAAVVIVADASALARSLYLVVEVLETSVPVVVALSMMDEARDRGFSIDVETLTSTLGAPVVPVVAPKGEGLGALRDAVARAVQGDTLAAASRPALPPDTEASIAEVVEAIEHHGRVAPAARRALASWLLLSLDEHGPDELAGIDPALRDAARRVQRRAASDGRDLDREIIGARYAFVDALVARSVTVAPPPGPSWTERIDGLLTHRVWGFLVFAVVMLALFQALFSWSEPAIGFIEAQVTTLQNLVTDAMPEGLLRDLLVNGVIAGVGNVLVFVPQIALLFLFIAVMEDVGYLARVAFVIDRVMGRVGLHGKSFVPMLSGFSCAVPAVLATRTLEHRTDRLLTMMVLPLMSCSARLPIYVLVIATVFDTSARVFGLMSVGAVALFAMYMLSVTAALGAAAVLRRTVLRGPRPTLLLELPPYRTPVPRVLLRTTWQQVRSFLLDAGTIILALTIILWALLSFPRDAAVAERYARERAQVEAARDRGRARRGAPNDRRARAGRTAAAQHRRAARARDRAPHRAARLRLAHRCRDHRRLRGARGVRLDDGRGVRPGRGRRGEPAAERSPARRDTRGRDAPDDAAHGRVAHGVLRPGVPVHEHDRGGAARIGRVAVAPLHVRLPDRAGLRGGTARLPGGPSDRVLRTDAAVWS
jgi:ferrous iron transport protein B